MAKQNKKEEGKVERYTSTPSRDSAIKKYGDTSKSIRGIRAEHKDWTEGQIARHLNIRPQHVNNVLKTPLKNKS